MLVLTRKIDQGIVIAGNIYVRVLGVERDRVKIGIAAPRDIPVLRLELLERDGEDAPVKSGQRNSAGDLSASTATAREDSTTGES